jgi:3-hydroxyacyl-CoA dehydrogenase/enoyl-CoA hydratase/3-hydroxybutyryl-CoA epimerase
VRLKDASHEAVGRGLAHVRGLLDERVKRRRLTRLEAASRMDRIAPTVDY